MASSQMQNFKSLPSFWNMLNLIQVSGEIMKFGVVMASSEDWQGTPCMKCLVVVFFSRAVPPSKSFQQISVGIFSCWADFWGFRFGTVLLVFLCIQFRLVLWRYAQPTSFLSWRRSRQCFLCRLALGFVSCFTAPAEWRLHFSPSWIKKFKFHYGIWLNCQSLVMIEYAGQCWLFWV